MEHSRRLFIDALSEQVQRLRHAMEAHQAGQPGSEATLRRLAHALRGSGASCGFPTVTELAATAESAPRDRLAEAVEALTAELEHLAEGPARHRVLIVDDDPLISRLLEMRLASPDREVETVEGLAAAREAIAADPPQLVVLDLFLPDGDGRTLLGELRSTESTARLPVIVISAAAGESAQRECEALGSDGYLAKPFDPDQLAGLVASLLERSRGPLPSEGRETLMSAYRRLLSSGRPISVTAIVPETHGPGGRRSEGPDPKTAGAVLGAVVEVLPPGATGGEWADGEPAVVADGTSDVTAALDRARLRLRNHPHPTLPGAIVSFSAATIPDDAGGGLGDTYARARQFALDANRGGGDRVVSPTPKPRVRRVLLAEDDALTAALIINRLEEDGFEVEHHPDGVSALEAAEHADFGLIVVDVSLPGLDGFEVIQRVRGTTAGSEIPIVVVTTVGSERDVARGFELGADDYLLKPFSSDELTSRLRRFTRP